MGPVAAIGAMSGAGAPNPLRRVTPGAPHGLQRELPPRSSFAGELRRQLAESAPQALAAAAGTPAPAAPAFPHQAGGSPPDGPRAAGVTAPWMPSGVGDVPADRLPQGQEGLVWAARELEAQLWAWLLKEALQSGDGVGLFGRGFAASVYQEWLAQSIAELVVQSGPAPLSELLVEQLTSPGRR